MSLEIAVPDSVVRLAPGHMVDFARMRGYRLARARQAMADADLDVVMLGVNANIHYISGARRLWQSGSAPYGPTCVVVGDTGDVYLQSTTTDGIPDDIPVKNLYPLSWNPGNTLRFLSGIRGVREARRVGVDGMSPFFAKLLAEAAPQAAFVSAEPALRRARAIKGPDEVQCLRIATRIAGEAVNSAREAASPGAAPRTLRAIAMERMTAFGATIPGHEGLFAALPRDSAAPFKRLIGDDDLVTGDHVALGASVMYAGYEGSTGRTVVCGDDHGETTAIETLRRRWQEQWEALRALMRPGTTFVEIQNHLRANTTEGSSFISVNGMGIGMEPPLMHSAHPLLSGPAESLQAGMVLAVESYISLPSAGGYYHTDTVAITDAGCEMMSAGI